MGSRSRTSLVHHAFMVLGVATVMLVLFAAVACSQNAGSATRPASAKSERASSPVSVVASDGEDSVEIIESTPDPIEQKKLDAALLKAIRTAPTSLSAEELDAYIRNATNAAYSLVVAPYDPKHVGETTVASHGLDAAITDEFEGIVQESHGKPVLDFDAGLVDKPLYFAGRPVRVNGRAGYVLVGRTAQ